MTDNITCPACNYTRRPGDSGIVPDWQCPMCQKAYAKISNLTTGQEQIEPVHLEESADNRQAAPQSVIDKAIETPEDYFAFDATRFSDPIAMEIRWSHNQDSYDGSFRKLVQVSGNRVEFRASGRAKFLGPFFGLFGGGGTAFLIFLNRNADVLNLVVSSFFALLFLCAGYSLFRRAGVPAVFDKATGFFYKQRMTTSGLETDSKGYIARLTDIHAIQLISFFVNNNIGRCIDSWYLELNLVLNDCSRMNVVRYSPYTRNYRIPDSYFDNAANALREDAKELSRFLGKPVWDAIDETKSLTRNKPISF